MSDDVQTSAPFKVPAGTPSKIVLAGLILFFIMGVFPPWKFSFRSGYAPQERPAGYSPIFLPPKPKTDLLTQSVGVQIDTTRLLLQWVVLAAMVAFGFMISPHIDVVLRDLLACFRRPRAESAVDKQTISEATTQWWRGHREGAELDLRRADGELQEEAARAEHERQEREAEAERKRREDERESERQRQMILEINRRAEERMADVERFGRDALDGPPAMVLLPRRGDVSSPPPSSGNPPFTLAGELITERTTGDLASLRVLNGAKPGQVIALAGDSIRLGRDPSCQLVISGTSVSRAHALILQIDDRYFIEDTNSRNGTWINNERISRRVQLKTTDQIRIGEFLCRFHEPLDPLLKYCNCARCGARLLGDSLARWYGSLSEERKLDVPKPVAGRLAGRPYCDRCLQQCTEHEGKTLDERSRKHAPDVPLDDLPWTEEQRQRIKKMLGESNSLGAGTGHVPLDDHGPWQENAERAWEDSE